MDDSISGRKPVALQCAVCGDYAGKWMQHNNRDNGYGVCKPCVEWLVDVCNYSDSQMKNDYGVAGVNYEDPSK